MTFSVRRLTRLGLRDILIAGMLLFMLATQGLPALRAAAQDGGGEPRAVMSDAFTYQGRLVKDGVPAEGAHDFEFALYDAHSGGNLLQTLPVLTGVPVTNGVFTVQLAFASLQFQGQQRFLEVRSRPAGGGAFTVMGRQELTATPYALYAKATDWNGVANKPAGFTDGVDNDTTYTATSPLALSGNLFTFSTSGCNADYVWKYNGAGWQCVPDGGTWANITAKPIGFADNVDNDTLGSLAGCTNGQIAKYNGSAWSCQDGNHFGETWTGNANSPLGDGSGLTINNTDTTGTPAALRTEAHGNGVGLSATNNDGGYGVIGSAEFIFASPDRRGIGVVGRSSFVAQEPPLLDAKFAGSGVYGETGTGSAGVSGYSPWTGVLGVSSLMDCAIPEDPAGVIGTSCSSIGVLGFSKQRNGVAGSSSGTGTSSAGVAGYSFGDCPVVGNDLNHYCIGVYGEAFDAASVGVFGKASHIGVAGEGTTWAGYFTGNVGVTNTLTAFSSATVGGTLTVAGGCVGCVAPSDARLKRDIVPSDYGLEAVSLLEPVSFAYTDDRYGPGTHLGFLAQDVQEVLPELVFEGAEGYLRVDYDGVVPVLVRAIQEQQAEIESLQGQLNAGSADSGANAPAPSNAAPSGAGHDPLTWVALALAGVSLLGWLVLGWKWRAAPVGARVRPHSPA